MEHKFKNIEQSEYWNEKSGPKWVKLDEAKQIFAGTSIQFTTAGKRYIGAAIGNRSFRAEYAKSLIDG